MKLIDRPTWDGMAFFLAILFTTKSHGVSTAGYQGRLIADATFFFSLVSFFIASRVCDYSDYAYTIIYIGSLVGLKIPPIQKDDQT